MWLDACGAELTPILRRMLDIGGNMCATWRNSVRTQAGQFRLMLWIISSEWEFLFGIAPKPRNPFFGRWLFVTQLLANKRILLLLLPLFQYYFFVIRLLQCYDRQTPIEILSSICAHKLTTATSILLREVQAAAVLFSRRPTDCKVLPYLPAPYPTSPPTSSIGCCATPQELNRV